MYTKAFIGLAFFLSLWSCVSEINLSKPSNPALLITQIHLAFIVDDTRQLNNLMVDKDELINTLTDKNDEIIYAYDFDLFTMATDDETYEAYKRRVLKSYQTIKEHPVNWKKTNIQKATYQTDSLQITIKGCLLIRDDKNNIDSIHFKGVKLLNSWVLTELN